MHIANHLSEWWKKNKKGSFFKKHSVDVKIRNLQRNRVC